MVLHPKRFYEGRELLNTSRWFPMLRRIAVADSPASWMEFAPPVSRWLSDFFDPFDCPLRAAWLSEGLIGMIAAACCCGLHLYNSSILGTSTSSDRSQQQRAKGFHHVLAEMCDRLQSWIRLLTTESERPRVYQEVLETGGCQTV
jgi:hypothetical protein